MELAQLLPLTLIGLKKAWEWAKDNDLHTEVKTAGKSLFTWVGRLFRSKAETERALSNLREDAQDVEAQDTIQSALKEKLEDAPALQQELLTLLHAMDEAAQKHGLEGLNMAQFHQGTGDNVGRDKDVKRTVTQGDKSQYFENNQGTINIS